MPEVYQPLIEAAGHDQNLGHRLDHRACQSSTSNRRRKGRFAPAPGQTQGRIVRLAERPPQKPFLPGEQLQLLARFAALADDQRFEIVVKVFHRMV